MQFIDRAEIEVEGGKGGDGIVAFRREKYVPAGGPAGGNGGKGGSVIFVATQNLQTLLDFQYSRYFKADDGKRGGPNNCTEPTVAIALLKFPVVQWFTISIARKLSAIWSLPNRL